MDKVLGTVFGAAASATKVMTAAPLIVLTPHEIFTRIVLAALVAIPGAVVGYATTLFCKFMHKTIKAWVDKFKQRPARQRRNRLFSFFVSLALILTLIPIIGTVRQHKIDGAAANLTNIPNSMKPASHIKVIIIAGHGRTDKGVYPTPGKQSPTWPDSLGCLKIYEGDSNHRLGFDLASSLLASDIDVELITYSYVDLSLYQRVNIVNAINDKDSRVILIALHHNAQPNISGADYYDSEGFYGWFSPISGGATGTEVYTSPGQTESDIIAEYIIQNLKDEFPQMNMRTDTGDGDRDKEALFTVLTQTKCPAVLVEWMFMTTYTDCLIIDSQNSRKRFVRAITNAFVEYNSSLGRSFNIAA